MRTVWPTMAGFTGALSHTSRIFLSMAAARGSPSSRVWKFSPLKSLNGSQSAGTKASQVMVRGAPGTPAAGLLAGLLASARGGFINGTPSLG